MRQKSQDNCECCMDKTSNGAGSIKHDDATNRIHIALTNATTLQYCDVHKPMAIHTSRMSTSHTCFVFSKAFEKVSHNNLLAQNLTY